MATASSFWCYNCRRLVIVRISADDVIVCPECACGFLESVEGPPRLSTPPPELIHRHSRRRVPTTATDHRFPPNRRASAGDRSPFNPVIVLRGGASSYGLYYDDGAGSGLRPIPESMSNFLMGSGFDRLLNQLVHIEITGWRSNPPASKASIESMPTVVIAAGHVSTDSHCAVCKEAFQLNDEAREMPCKHIYHQDCILPWLSLSNTCPVCRYEMPTDVGTDLAAPDNGVEEEEEEGPMGLTIWRLPGGGFAVGRFSGRRREGEQELPVVYTEMDGGFNNGSTPRRISWTSRGSRSRERSGIGHAFRNFFSFFRHRRS